MMLIFYISSILILIKRRDWIIYLMCLTVPFYDVFDPIFLKLHMGSVTFTLKPFLFFEILLILLCVYEVFKRKRFFSDIIVSNKLSFAFLFFYAVLALFYTLKETPGAYVGFNLCLMVSMVIFLPYYYKDKKVELDKIMKFLFIGLVLSYIPMLSEIIMTKASLIPQPEYGHYKIYGLTYVLISFFIIYRYLTASDKRRLAVFTALLFFDFLMIFLTRTRASWWALFLCLPMYAFFLIRKLCFFKMSRLRILCLYILLLCAFMAAVFIESPILADLSPVYNIIVAKDFSMHLNLDPIIHSIESRRLRILWFTFAHERTIAWRKTLQHMLHNPFRGYGLIYSLGSKGTHNTLLRVFLSSSVVGFISYIIAFLFIFIVLIKKILNNTLQPNMRFFYFSLLLAVLAWGINGLLQTNLNEYLPWFFIAITFLFVNNCNKGSS